MLLSLGLDIHSLEVLILNEWCKRNNIGYTYLICYGPTGPEASQAQ